MGRSQQTSRGGRYRFGEYDWLAEAEMFCMALSDEEAKVALGEARGQIDGWWAGGPLRGHACLHVALPTRSGAVLLRPGLELLTRRLSCCPSAA